MANLNKATVVKQLIDSGVRIDLANQYGDAFMEYMNATRNIDEFGVIVKHPRTGNPIENPYLAIRDRALKKLQAMEMVRADFLWEQYA
jgi:phage terminase small subunit